MDIEQKSSERKSDDIIAAALRPCFELWAALTREGMIAVEEKIALGRAQRAKKATETMQ